MHSYFFMHLYQDMFAKHFAIEVFTRLCISRTLPFQILGVEVYVSSIYICLEGVYSVKY